MEDVSSLQQGVNEHSVLVFLHFPDGVLENEKKLDAIFELQNIFSEVLAEDDTGYCDGNEFFENTVTFFLYGKDSEAIYEAIFPLLSYVPALPGSYVVKRAGGLGTPEEQIFL